MRFGGYNFEGPYAASQLRDEAGVYVAVDSSKNVKYVGQSTGVKSRVEGTHDNKSCWQRNGCSKFGVRYGGDKETRLKIEKAVVRAENPVCND